MNVEASGELGEGVPQYRGQTRSRSKPRAQVFSKFLKIAAPHLTPILPKSSRWSALLFHRLYSRSTAIDFLVSSGSSFQSRRGAHDEVADVVATAGRQDGFASSRPSCIQSPSSEPREAKSFAPASGRLPESLTRVGDLFSSPSSTSSTKSSVNFLVMRMTMTGGEHESRHLRTPLN